MQDEVKKIYVIAPLVETPQLSIAVDLMQGALTPLQVPGIQIIAKFLTNGPSSIENELDDALCIPETLREAIIAKDEGARGIIVNCMCDPGVKALRTILDIPVIGPAETAFHLAASLGHKFSVVDIGDDTAPMVEDQVYRYGLWDKFASIRGTGISVEGIHSEDNNLFNQLGAAATLAVREDGADVIVLGCTGFTGCAEAVKGYLEQQGIFGVPVIDPLPLAVRTLIGIVQEGLCHSKRAFRTPKIETKRLQGFALNDPLQRFYAQTE